jgi:hypothetical protein
MEHWTTIAEVVVLSATKAGVVENSGETSPHNRLYRSGQEAWREEQQGTKERKTVRALHGKAYPH